MAELGRYIPVSKARNRLPKLVRELEQQQEAVALTRDGVPVAVLLNIEHFRGLLETIEILVDSESLRSLRRSLKQAEQGEWLPHREVFDRDPS